MASSARSRTCASGLKRAAPTDIAANYDNRLSGAGATLIGYWRLDDGSGQTLENEVGADGTRGASTAEEASDPAWSTDGPNID